MFKWREKLTLAKTESFHSLTVFALTKWLIRDHILGWARIPVCLSACVCMCAPDSWASILSVPSFFDLPKLPRTSEPTFLLLPSSAFQQWWKAHCLFCAEKRIEEEALPFARKTRGRRKRKEKKRTEIRSRLKYLSFSSSHSFSRNRI